jgi:hypothetical protein
MSLALRDRARPILVAVNKDTNDLDEFIAYGERLVSELLMVAHGPLPATDVDRRAMNRWGKLAVKALRPGSGGYVLVREYARASGEPGSPP